MTRRVSGVIEQDERGCYAWCPELKGCQSQGTTVEEALANIREAAQLFLAEALLLKAGFVWLRSKGSHRIYQSGNRRIVVPSHAGIVLHPKVVKEIMDAISECSGERSYSRYTPHQR